MREDLASVAPLASEFLLLVSDDRRRQSPEARERDWIQYHERLLDAGTLVVIGAYRPQRETAPIGYAVAERDCRGCLLPSAAGVRIAVLRELFVSPGHRGQGVGAQLVRAVEVWARGASQDAILLKTNSAHGDAIAFYRRLGYEAHNILFRRQLSKC